MKLNMQVENWILYEDVNSEGSIVFEEEMAIRERGESLFEDGHCFCGDFRLLLFHVYLLWNPFATSSSGWTARSAAHGSGDLILCRRGSGSYLACTRQDHCNTC